MREKLKLYYRCRFTQLSPLRLSGGKNDRTDNDLMLDSRGLPRSRAARWPVCCAAD